MLLNLLHLWGFPGGSDCRVCLQCRRPRFGPWVGKIPWKRKWQPTPVFLAGEARGWRSLAGYSPVHGVAERDTTEQLHSLTHSGFQLRRWAVCGDSTTHTAEKLEDEKDWREKGGHVCFAWIADMHGCFTGWKVLEFCLYQTHVLRASSLWHLAFVYWKSPFSHQAFNSVSVHFGSQHRWGHRKSNSSFSWGIFWAIFCNDQCCPSVIKICLVSVCVLMLVHDPVFRTKSWVRTTGMEQWDVVETQLALRACGWVLTTQHVDGQTVTFGDSRLSSRVTRCHYWERQQDQK